MNRALLLAALSACYLCHYPLTPSIAKQASYKVFMANGGQGTAWAVDAHHLLTAGHVCESISNAFVVVGDFRRFHAHAILWEQDEAGQHDLCVLETTATMDSHLIVADRMPRVKERVGYVGFPLGEYSESSGQYIGDLDGPDKHLNDDVFSAVCDHGASGSAVFHDGGVWGVLVRLRTDGGFVHDGTDGCVAIPLPAIKKILHDAGVSYDVPPTLPED